MYCQGESAVTENGVGESSEEKTEGEGETEEGEKKEEKAEGAAEDKPAVEPLPPRAAKKAAATKKKGKKGAKKGKAKAPRKGEYAHINYKSRYINDYNHLLQHFPNLYSGVLSVLWRLEL